MFEKEAEEYATRNVFFDGVPKPVFNPQRKEDWKNGAEFGYNKALKWHDLRKNYNLPSTILALWENAVCDIRAEIKSQETLSLGYAKALCDKLETSMVAIAKGDVEYAHFSI